MSGITLKHVTPATIPTPAAGKSTIFINDSDADTPYYKDPSGTSTSLKGAAGDGYDTVQAHGNTGATETFDYATADFHTATLDANCTFTFTGAVNNVLAIMGLRLTQDGTGSRTVTWPASVAWSENGTAPVLQTAAAAVDELWFVTTDGGTTWYGHYARLPLTTRGDIVYRNASNVTARLGRGSADTYLGSDGTDIAYSAVTDAKLSTSDITTNNASTTKHGFLKKLDNTATNYMDGTGNWSVPAGSGGGITFKRTVLNGGGNLTTTSTTKTPVDATNLAYLTHTLSVNDIVRCTFMATYKHSGTVPIGVDFEVDQPTSANVYVGAGSDYGCAVTTPSTERRAVCVVGTFIATESGSHGFRPVWLTDSGTATICNAASGNDDALVTLIVEKLGASA